MKTLAICNNKGGVGKTATCLAFTESLHNRGMRTLLVDLDQQINATQAADVNTGDGVVTAYDLLTTEDYTAAQAIQHYAYGDIVPGDNLVSDAETVMSKLDTPLTMLADALEGVRENYDYIIIDCPPSLGLVTKNAIVASDDVIIVVQPDDASVTGCGNVVATVDKIRRNKHLNPNVQVAGILINYYDGRKVLSRTVDDTLPEFAHNCGTVLYDTRIRACESIRQAQSAGKSIYDFAPKSAGAEDFDKFVTEYLERENKRSASAID